MAETKAGPDGDRLLLGVITGAQGLRGELWIKSFTGDPTGIGDYGPLTDESGRKSYRVRVKDLVKGKVLATIQGVGDRTAVERLKGEKLYVDRALLPEPEEEEYYYADLVGLRVELPDGDSLGVVKAVHDFGAGDVLDVAGDGKGKGVMIPFTRAAVPVVDLAGGRVVVDPPPGLLEDVDPEDGRDGEDER